MLVTGMETSKTGPQNGEGLPVVTTSNGWEQLRQRRLRNRTDPGLDALVTTAKDLPQVRTWAARLDDLGLAGFEDLLRAKLAGRRQSSAEELEVAAREATADVLKDAVAQQLHDPRLRRSVARRLSGRQEPLDTGDMLQDTYERAATKIEEFRRGERDIPPRDGVGQWLYSWTRDSIKRAVNAERRLRIDRPVRPDLVALAGPRTPNDRAFDDAIADPTALDAFDDADARVVLGRSALQSSQRDDLVEHFRTHLAQAESDLSLHSPEAQLPTAAAATLRARIPAFVDCAAGFLRDLVRHQAGQTPDEYEAALRHAMACHAPSIYEAAGSNQNRTRDRAHINHLVQSFFATRDTGVTPDVPELARLVTITTSHQALLVTQLLCQAHNHGVHRDCIDARTQWLTELTTSLAAVPAPQLASPWLEDVREELVRSHNTEWLHDWTALPDGPGNERRRRQGEAALAALDALSTTIRTMMERADG